MKPRFCILLLLFGIGYCSEQREWNNLRKIEIGTEAGKPIGLIAIGVVDGKTFYTDEQAIYNGTTFWEAMEYCHRLGLFPAAITSAAQTHVIVNALASSRPFWLPATDVGSEGNFRWVRNGQPIWGYSDWIPGNPNSDHNVNYNCGFIYPDTAGGNGTWFNLPCWTSWRSLCEYP